MHPWMNHGLQTEAEAAQLEPRGSTKLPDQVEKLPVQGRKLPEQVNFRTPLNSMVDAPGNFRSRHQTMDDEFSAFR